MKPAQLRCSGVGLTVDHTTILRDLDLTVPAGTLTCVVGPSGAGKTTLLRAIAGLERLDEGSIRLGDRELAPLPSHRRQLAVVFQEPRLFPHLTVGANVAFPLRVAGVAKAARQRAAAALLDEVGLPGLAGRSPRGLSGGEQQRVALARALAADPALLLLDEPLSAIDPTRRQDLRQLIASLQRQRRLTTVYVTHDRSEAAELGDQVALLVEGRVLDHAPPRQLYERPSSAVVARFFGARNVLSGTVAGGWLTVGSAEIPVEATDGYVTVAIGPERLQLSPTGPIRGTVVTSTYHGTHQRLSVDCGGVAIEAHVDTGAAVAVGNQVRLAVASEHVWVIPDVRHSARRP